MTSDLVPVANMAAVEALTPEAQALAVTSMLTEARSWLAHAKEASEPQSIANFKAQMATVAEATKQLGLSKDIQMDAVEMVRRAERGVGLAIRKGQAEGTVARRGQGANGRPPNAHRDRADSGISSPSDFVAADELGSNGAGIYHMTDGVTNEEFDSALAEAKAEENLSRANVVRKINSQDGPKMRGQKRLDRITELAAKGWTSRQIGAELGHSDGRIREWARDAGITINADVALGRSHRNLDHTRIARETVATLEALVSGLQILKPDEVDTADAEQWVTSLNDSLRGLNRFHKQLKEMTHSGDDQSQA